jgi:hypothetical protein
MSVEVGTPVRLDGSVRSPDREGATAHLDLDRGFALVARASLTGFDVVDPVIWVREKLALAHAATVDEPPLRPVLGAIRSLHGEIMKRNEADRSWISTGVLLFHGDDGVAIAAGDCPCLRYRDGVLSSLGRGGEEGAGGAPRGSLGSEPQVRIEVVPLRPLPGDLYLLATRPLREGELAILSRALEGARSPAEMMRVALEGAHDTGQLVVRVLSPSESRTGPERAGPPGDVVDLDDAAGAPPLVVTSMAEAVAVPKREMTEGDRVQDPLAVGAPLGEPREGTEAERADVPATVGPALTPELEPPASVPEAVGRPESDDSEEEPLAEANPALDAGPETPPARTRRALATVGEDRPWYEPLALWGGGALAIIALALLVRAILPGIIGAGGGRGGASASKQDAGRVTAAAVTGTSIEIVSEPPGAVVRLNGEALPGRTPLSAVAVDPGIHRVELDWGAGGTWRDTVEVAAGARLTLHPAIYGSLAFRSSDPARVLDVYVDGAYAGTTPLSLDRVTVGRHLVRFGGPGLALTAQEVDVLRDVHVELVGNAGAAPAPGRVAITSAILGDEGFQPGRGDPLWIDGMARGATPFTVSLAPGMHSVRVVRRNFPAQVVVIDVKPGNEHFVTAEFGARSGEPLRFSPPSGISRSSPTPLTISLPGDAPDTDHSVWLYAAAPGGSFQARATTRLAAEGRTYAALVPDEVLRNEARQIRVFFKATAPGGHEIFSEIHTIPVLE